MSFGLASVLFLFKERAQKTVGAGSTAEGD
jgi:hypothetical protein